VGVSLCFRSASEAISFAHVCQGFSRRLYDHRAISPVASAPSSGIWLAVQGNLIFSTFCFLHCSLLSKANYNTFMHASRDVGPSSSVAFRSRSASRLESPFGLVAFGIVLLFAPNVYGAASLGSSVRLAGSNACGGAVRWALPLPHARNGCVSGEFVVRVGRLLARATNCRSALLVSCFPGY